MSDLISSALTLAQRSVVKTIYDSSSQLTSRSRTPTEPEYDNYHNYNSGNQQNSGRKLSGGAIAGIVIGCLAFVFLFILLAYLLNRHWNKKDERPVGKEIDEESIESSTPYGHH